jgi:DNA anti-recombination protein RmuC
MISVESLKRKATGLSGAMSPGDAREVARIISDLCDRLGELGGEVSELGKRMQDAEREIVQLRDAVTRQS